MNRIDRISAILIQLQSHSLVKAQQISERFNISIRTVYRDIRTLEEAGIPIIGNPGIGYSLAEGFKLSPLMFTQKEALSFLIAEKLVHELTDSNSNEHYKSGIEKIRSVMRFADKNMLETMEKCMSVLDTYKSSTYKPDILLLILQSIYQKRKNTGIGTNDSADFCTCHCHWRYVQRCVYCYRSRGDWFSSFYDFSMLLPHADF